MSKVIHLSDEAHNRAKGFCRQHGLKMSDWVAELIAEAISSNRVDPRAQARPAPQPVVAAAPPAAAPQQPHTPASNLPPKKRLERLAETSTNEDGVPPWAAPPFWTRANK